MSKFDRVAKGIGKAVEGVGNMVQNAGKALYDTKLHEKIALTATRRVVKPVGKVAGNSILKAGAHAAEFASKVDDMIEATDFEQIGKSMTNKAKKVGKAVGGFAKNRAGDAAQGANKVVNALGGMVETAEKLKLLKKVDFDKSMIGYKLTPGGMAVAAGGGLIASTIGGTKDYLGQRQGRNDGQTYSVTPSMVNPYTISQQMAYSQTGRSYADNAGADPGLAAAIMRR